MPLGILRRIEGLAEAFLVLLVAAMTVACLAQVIWRYAFDSPLIWSEELARYLFVWIGYLGAWVAWKRGQHIALDAIQFIRSKALHQISARFSEAVVLLFCLYSAWGNIELLSITGDQPSAVLEIPMLWVYLAHSVMATLISADILIRWFALRLVAVRVA
jgi:TRAP-type transport system small permease protein